MISEFPQQTRSWMQKNPTVLHGKTVTARAITNFTILRTGSVGYIQSGSFQSITLMILGIGDFIWDKIRNGFFCNDGEFEWQLVSIYDVDEADLFPGFFTKPSDKRIDPHY